MQIAKSTATIEKSINFRIEAKSLQVLTNISKQSNDEYNSTTIQSLKRVLLWRIRKEIINNWRPKLKALAFDDRAAINEKIIWKAQKGKRKHWKEKLRTI